MTSRDFCFWLQGYFEVTDPGSAGRVELLADQVDCVRKHLALVFVHEIDPSAGDAGHQEALNAIHNPPGKPSPQIGGQGPDGTIARC